MKYIVDVDAGTVEEYKDPAENVTVTTVPQKTRQERMLDVLKSWTGAKEWDGIVSGIQKWYYGYVSRTSWCATTMSYLLAAVGINIKAENVYDLLKKAENSGIGRVYTRNDLNTGLCEEIHKGDILFFLWEGDTMSATSKKHVTMANETTKEARIKCLGGNQSDGITGAIYNKNKLFAVWRID